jgi:hypothetical protein
MAQASKESAEIMAALGHEQLDLAKQQYADNKPFLQGIAQQQMDISDQTRAQGEDYYNYLKQYRPLELSMRDDAMADRSGELSDYDLANRADAALISGPNSGLYNARQGDIDWQVNNAVADAQGAYTRATNQAIRQGLRYGAAAPNMVGQVGSIGLTQAQNIAAAANAARMGGIDQARQLTASGLQLRQGNMDALQKQRAIDWAKKLDAVGLAKGMPGASAGAYGLAVNAGNSAGQNYMAPGQAMQSGFSAGANTIGQGRSLYEQGLGNILNAQTSVYDSSLKSGLDVGGLLSGGAALMKAWPSDVRLKDNIKFVGVDPDTGIGLYEFNYYNDDTRYRGVLAQEVMQTHPDAVIQDEASGYLVVDYGMLGIEMEKVA